MNAMQTQLTNNINAESTNGAGAASDKSYHQVANASSSRAPVNSNGSISVQPSSISLKQTAQATINQTARDFTPNKKPYLVSQNVHAQQ